MTTQCHIGSAILGGKATRRGPHRGQPTRTPGPGFIYPKQATSELIPQGQSQCTGCLSTAGCLKSLKTQSCGGEQQQQKKQTFFRPLLLSLTSSCPSGSQSVLTSIWRDRQGRWGQGSNPRRNQPNTEGHSTDACYNVAAPKILCSGKEARREDHMLCDSWDRKYPETAKPYRE